MQIKTSCICFSLLSTFSSKDSLSKETYLQGVYLIPSSCHANIQWVFFTNMAHSGMKVLLPVCHMYRRPKWKVRETGVTADLLGLHLCSVSTADGWQPCVLCASYGCMPSVLWWTSRPWPNSLVILGFDYMGCCLKYGGCPLRVRSLSTLLLFQWNSNGVVPKP